MLQAGEGQGEVYTDATHGFADAGWAPPQSVSHEQEQALRSDLATLSALLANGCDEDWAYQRLAELAAITTTRRDVSENEYAYKLQIMAQELSRYPAKVVQSACERYPRECKWFPELADILDYADAGLQPLNRDKARIERCLQRRQHEKPRPAWRPPKQSDRDYARELVAGFRKQVADLDAQERAENRAKPSGIKPARKGLPPGPGERAARGETYSVLGSMSGGEVSDD